MIERLWELTLTIISHYCSVTPKKLGLLGTPWLVSEHWKPLARTQCLLSTCVIMQQDSGWVQPGKMDAGQRRRGAILDIEDPGREPGHGSPKAGIHFPIGSRHTTYSPALHRQL